MHENRAKRARERAGLSIVQAAKLTGIRADELLELEELTTLADADAERLVEIYGVTIEWLTGKVAQLDFEALDKIKGSQVLSFHDRNVIAEFIAALPRRERRNCATCGAPFAAPNPPQENVGRETYLCKRCR